MVLAGGRPRHTFICELESLGRIPHANRSDAAGAEEPPKQTGSAALIPAGGPQGGRGLQLSASIGCSCGAPGCCSSNKVTLRTV